jgi:hypothetical protein
VQQSGDRGVDIVATKNQPIEQKHVLQVKRYDDGNRVGSQAVQQYSSLRQQEPGTDTVVIVTTSEFTHQARELAEQLNVKLVNGQALSRLIDRLDAEHLVNEYVGPDQDTQPQASADAETVSADGDGVDGELGDKEMRTDEALLAVFRLLLILGVFGYMAFYLVTHFLL